MFGAETSIVGVLVMVLTAAASFWIGRRLSNRWQQRRRDRETAAARAKESRQARRARERSERGR